MDSVSEIIPRPGRAFGDEIIAGENELVDAENAFLFECGDGAGARHSLHRPFERLVNFLRKHHLSLSIVLPGRPTGLLLALGGFSSF